MSKDSISNNIVRFSIRPKHHEGESLTSYLLRVCVQNGVSYLDLVKFVQPRRYMDVFYTRKNRIDTFPEQQVDIAKLSVLLDIDAEKIFAMSFTNLANKLMNGMNYSSMKYLNTLLPLIKKDKRWFCEKCIEENKGYKLLWQVVGIDYCLEHQRKLISYCSKCGHEQPYIHDNLGRYCCAECSTFLWECSVNSNEAFDYNEQENRYKNWEYLLGRNTRLVPLGVDQDPEKSLSIAFIYAVQSALMGGRQETYNYNVVKEVLREDYLHSLIRHIHESSTPHYVTLKQLITILEKIKMPMVDFANIVVPEEYLDSLQPKEGVSRNCLTPWCDSYKSADKLENLQSSKYLRFRNKRFSHACLCVDCNIPYAIDISTNKWSEFGDLVEKVDKVILMIHFGRSMNEIMKLLGISKLMYHKMIAYSLRYGLLPSELVTHLQVQIKPIEGLVDCFNILSDNSCNKPYHAKKIFGWSELEYYYYFYSPDVQRNYWFLQRYKRKGKKTLFEINPALVQAIDEKILENIKNEIDISIKEVAASIDINESTLTRAGLNEKIKEHAKIQRNEKGLKEKSELFILVNQYIEKKNQYKEIVKCKDVYEFIGKRPNSIKSTMPELASWISKQASISKERYQKDKIEDYKKRAKNIIFDAIKRGDKIPSARQIAIKLRILDKINTKYKDVNEEIKKIHASIHK